MPTPTMHNKIAPSRRDHGMARVFTLVSLLALVSSTVTQQQLIAQDPSSVEHKLMEGRDHPRVKPYSVFFTTTHGNKILIALRKYLASRNDDLPSISYLYNVADGQLLAYERGKMITTVLLHPVDQSNEVSLVPLTKEQLAAIGIDVDEILNVFRIRQGSAPGLTPRPSWVIVASRRFDHAELLKLIGPTCPTDVFSGNDQ